MSVQPSIRMIIADDHPMVREGLCAVVARQHNMCVVAQAGNGQEVVDLYRLHRPDVVLMDMTMPHLDGLAATRAIIAEFPQARIIILSLHAGEDTVYEAIQAGARAYMLKDAPAGTLLETIAQVACGQICLSAEIAAKIANRLHLQNLTGREKEILEHIVKGKSNGEIGAALFISEGTVKSHVNHLLAKLKVTDRTQAAVIAVKRGIVALPKQPSL
jgi:two-component system NarL family response regulator